MAQKCILVFVPVQMLKPWAQYWQKLYSKKEIIFSVGRNITWDSIVKFNNSNFEKIEYQYQ